MKRDIKLRHRDVEDALDLMGGRWRGAVLACLCDGPRRFSELKAELSPVSAKILIRELRYLELNQMVCWEKSTKAKNSVVYSMTEHGKTIKPVILAIQRWSLHHRALVLNG